MKVLSKCLVLVMVFSLATAFATAAQQVRPPQQQAQEEKAFEGALVKIDTNAHTLTAMGADNKEMQFVYTDATQVTGPEKSVQGLATKSGARLTISYRVAEGKNVATRIEIAAAEK